ncbi:hypothetical protein [Streptomyces sp. NPDC059247]|uniref:hypothetical protein n=1 Tax=Streptomyces sp. NPDC059247 TaxID=3346790 RepID=UPI0036CF41BC
MDTSTGRPRYGEIVRADNGLFVLRPPGGGAQWPASARTLRRPTTEEWASILLLITPVRREGP